MKSELTRAYEDVIGKYRLLSDNLEADFRTFENTQQARIFARKSEIAVKQEELMQLVRKEEEKIRTVQEEKIQTVDNRMQQLRDEQAQLESETSESKIRTSSSERDGRLRGGYQ